ncbi:putative Low-density lipoprotein receptor-related protein 2 [Hypsibius exemplaris]|uniref:Low-density lipoprotein receptor-related protein 2 n=1 Tax=Hypsibius exemplaris TaxID=2072580 RepID=A0A9X6NIF5_HYPEX|nr:putative Low-density lipoprotein receptor-related protein 2 [Hypsibius exemplaris]
MWLLLTGVLACTTVIPSAVAEKCLSDEFACLNSGRCILARYRCDGTSDCSDGSDESPCPGHPDGLSQQLDHPVALRDCQWSVGWDGFQCADSGTYGSCWPKTLICDGQNDCADHSDEWNCTSTVITPPNSGGNAHLTAARTECNWLFNGDGFRCANDSKSCWPKRWFCDGSRDCPDNSDERNCPGSTSTTTAVVPTTSSAELSPYVYSTTEKPCSNSTQYFWCLSNTGFDGRCLPRYLYICDGTFDCFGGTDEQNCPGSSALSGARRTTTAAPLPSYVSLDLFTESSQQHPCQTPGDFWCPSKYSITGRCIPSYYRCDGFPDCRDENDEQNCPAKKTTTTTSSSFLSGGSNSTYPYELSDFEDSATEQPCLHSAHFWCRYQSGKNGRCLPASWKCDGVINCFGGTDEQNCPGSISRLATASSVASTSSSVTTNNPQGTCTSSDSEFQCKSGECIPIGYRCSGYYANCWDGSDEKDCENHVCGVEQFRCSSGHCIHKSWKCDGEADCATDSSDEMDCPTNNSMSIFVTPSSPLERLNSSLLLPIRTCVPYSDGKPRFRCTSGECISGESRCNGVVSCSDGSDEASCPASTSLMNSLFAPVRHSLPGATTCLSTEFRCRSGECIDLDRRCDTYRTCADASDEIGCKSRKCSSGEFRCDSGQCVPTLYRCNGIKGCSDGSDEMNCTTMRFPSLAGTFGSANLFSLSSILGGQLYATTTPDPVNDHRGEWMGQMMGWMYRNAVDPNTLTAKIIGKSLCLSKGPDDPQSLYSSLFGLIGTTTTPSPANDHRGDWQAQVFLWAFRNAVDLDKVTARTSGNAFCLE